MDTIVTMPDNFKVLFSYVLNSHQYVEGQGINGGLLKLTLLEELAVSLQISFRKL